MSAANRPITIEQGATFQNTLSFKKADGSDLDVSGWTFTGQIRSTYSDLEVLATFVFSDGLSTNKKVVTITASNTLLIPVDPSPSYKLRPTVYAYDIVAVIDDGSTLRLMEGSVSVIPTVTKAVVP